MTLLDVQRGMRINGIEVCGIVKMKKLLGTGHSIKDYDL